MGLSPLDRRDHPVILRQPIRGSAVRAGLPMIRVEAAGAGTALYLMKLKSGIVSRLDIPLHRHDEVFIFSPDSPPIPQIIHERPDPDAYHAVCHLKMQELQHAPVLHIHQRVQKRQILGPFIDAERIPPVAEGDRPQQRDEPPFEIGIGKIRFVLPHPLFQFFLRPHAF